MSRRLITISVSNFCEKARWALDRSGVEYVEEGHFPNLHYLASFRVAGTPYLPILIDQKKVIPDSTAILRYVDQWLEPSARLFPEGPEHAEVERLEEWLDAELGPTARRWAYWHWFTRNEEVLRYGGYKTPRWEQAIAPILLGGAKRITSWRLSVNEPAAKAAIESVRKIFDDVGERLRDGRRFLVGGRLSAADVAFAALGAPALLPPQHGVPVPPVGEAPPEMAKEIERLRETPAGAFALRLYAEERGAGSRA